MSDLILIRSALHAHDHHGGYPQVKLRAPRATLAKRRWRGTAEDGREFGFDLASPLTHGALFCVRDNGCYVVDQMPEEVLEIPFVTLEQAARVAWSLGNLHFGVQVLPDAVRVTEDPAVLQLLSREGIAHRRVTAVFLPLSAGAHSHHAHSHQHGE